VSSWQRPSQAKKQQLTAVGGSGKRSAVYRTPAPQAVQRSPAPDEEDLSKLGRLLSAVMHEINSPLEAVGNALFALRESQKLDAQSYAVVERAFDELQKVRQTADNTLSLSRPLLTLEPVDVRDVLDSVLHLFRNKVHDERIRVDRQYGTVTPVPASQSHMRQVFTNLIRNALEAAGHRGKITLRVRQTQIGTPGVRVYISDSGRGLDEESKRHWAQPFFNKKTDGTGLGLWVSNEIVRKHRGYIRVRNLLHGKGACFMVLLPATRAFGRLKEFAAA